MPICEYEIIDYIVDSLKKNKSLFTNEIYDQLNIRYMQYSDDNKYLAEYINRLISKNSIYSIPSDIIDDSVEIHHEIFFYLENIIEKIQEKNMNEKDIVYFINYIVRHELFHYYQFLMFINFFKEKSFHYYQINKEEIKSIMENEANKFANSNDTTLLYYNEKSFKRYNFDKIKNIAEKKDDKNGFQKKNE